MEMPTVIVPLVVAPVVALAHQVTVAVLVIIDIETFQLLVHSVKDFQAARAYVLISRVKIYTQQAVAAALVVRADADQITPMMAELVMAVQEWQLINTVMCWSGAVVVVVVNIMDSLAKQLLAVLAVVAEVQYGMANLVDHLVKSQVLVAVGLLMKVNLQDQVVAAAAPEVLTQEAVVVVQITETLPMVTVATA